MSDEIKNESPTEETPQIPAEGPEPTPEPAEQTGGADVRGTGNGGDDLEALRKQLQETRAEAAKYRVRAREATEALESMKPADEFEALKAETARLESELARTRVASKYGLPAELATRLTGDTPEALEEDAQKLSAFVQPTTLGRGGLTPAEDPTPASPAELAARIPRARR